MRVSVVIPSYNHARFIRQTVRSVLEQDHPDLELVVVDDGSTDNSVAIIEEEIGFFPDVDTILHVQSNHGAHAAINKGIELSTGHCITILNSDDYYLPGRIRRIVELAANRSLFFIFTGIDFVGDNGQILEREHPHSVWYRKILGRVEQAPTVGFGLLQDNLSVTSGNFAFSRALYDQIGGFSDYNFCHDWDFLMRAVRLVEPEYLDLPLLSYRVHETNSTHSLRHLQEEEVSQVLNGFLELCQLNGTQNPLAPCPENWPHFFEIFARKQSFHFGPEPIAEYIRETASESPGARTDVSSSS